MMNNNLKVIKDFEGSLIQDFIIEGNDVYIVIRKDHLTDGYIKTFNYNLHFHFGIENFSDNNKSVNIYIECHDKRELNESYERIWTSNTLEKDYIIENIEGKMRIPGQYYFKISLEPKERKFIANYSPISYERLYGLIEEKGLLSKARKNVIGKTVDGRDLLSYEYGDISTKPVLMFVSGFHPPERDPIAIEAIMDRMIDDKYSEKLLKKYCVVLIPFLNPDGFAGYKQGSNKNDINFHWRFFGNTKKECPESHYIWEYCKRILPVFYMDFHAFTFQNNEARPYLINEKYYFSSTSKNIQNNINAFLKGLCKEYVDNSIKIISPNILSARLREEFGTITSPKFHLHMKDGIKTNKSLSCSIFEGVVDIFNRNKITNKEMVLKIPYGNIKDNPILKIYYWITVRSKLFILHMVHMISK